MMKCRVLLVFAAVLAISPSVSAEELPIVYPVLSPTLSSSFGTRFHPVRHFSSFHQGVDLAAPKGSWVRAIRPGIVVFADYYQGYGRLVTIRHAGGFTSHYAHLSEIRVNPGDTVRAGDLIGLVGDSGLTTGPHLHFEWRWYGIALDPMEALNALNVYK